MTVERAAPLGLILAGGQARRMGGGDKPLRVVGGRTILARIIGRIGPQTAGLAISANGDPARFAALGLPVIADTLPGGLGPLAGVLAGLGWAAAQRSDVPWLLTVPGDAPFLPRDLVHRLAAGAAGGMAMALSGGRAHPVAALWPLALAGPLRAALEAGERRVEGFARQHGAALVEWPDAPVDPFFNANRPEDLGEAERLAAADPAP